MPRITYDQDQFDKTIQNLSTSYACDEELEHTVRTVLKDVRENGDRALIQYSKKWDGCSLEIDQIRVDAQTLKSCERDLSPELCSAFQLMQENLTLFHKQDIPQSWQKEIRPGLRLGRNQFPIQRVGIYIPGGTAPLFSTVFMTVILAKIAGVPEIVVVSPPDQKGNIHPIILAACSYLGVNEVYRVGGAQAIAALAYGTESIQKVFKIVGPGNAFVQMAKKLVYGSVDLDMIAGPSEIMVIADESANPEFIAADLLSQAEHDSSCRCFLVSPNADLIDNVETQVAIQLKNLARRLIAEKAWKANGWLILVRDLAQAVEVANSIAPEHLELCTAEDAQWVPKLHSVGAVFLGPFTPEAVGDYVAGPSHVLPTGGTAKFYSPLSVHSFLRSSSLVEYDSLTLEKESDRIKLIAESEGLSAHRQSIEFRF